MNTGITLKSFDGLLLIGCGAAMLQSVLRSLCLGLWSGFVTTAFLSLETVVGFKQFVGFYSKKKSLQELTFLCPLPWLVASSNVLYCWSVCVCGLD